jgi:hypothetical protein
LIFLAFGLFFMTRYASSRFWLLPHLTSEHKRNIQREWKISLKKMQHAFCRLVLPDVRRFWATFPRHGCEKEVCHKYSSSSYVRGMSNPITYITRIHLATERSRRMKKREKQKLARYKIYSAP